MSLEYFCSNVVKACKTKEVVLKPSDELANATMVVDGNYFLYHSRLNSNQFKNLLRTASECNVFVIVVIVDAGRAVSDIPYKLTNGSLDTNIYKNSSQEKLDNDDYKRTLFRRSGIRDKEQLLEHLSTEKVEKGLYVNSSDDADGRIKTIALNDVEKDKVIVVTGDGLLLYSIMRDAGVNLKKMYFIPSYSDNSEIYPLEMFRERLVQQHNSYLTDIIPTSKDGQYYDGFLSSDDNDERTEDFKLFKNIDIGNKKIEITIIDEDIIEYRIDVDDIIPFVLNSIMFNCLYSNVPKEILSIYLNNPVDNDLIQYLLHNHEMKLLENEKESYCYSDYPRLFMAKIIICEKIYYAVRPANCIEKLIEEYSSGTGSYVTKLSFNSDHYYLSERYTTSERELGIKAITVRSLIKSMNEDNHVNYRKIAEDHQQLEINRIDDEAAEDIDDFIPSIYSSVNQVITLASEMTNINKGDIRNLVINHLIRENSEIEINSKRSI